MYFITIPADSRLAVEPIPEERREIWEMVNTARQCFWLPSEFTTAEDEIHYRTRLIEGEKHFVRVVLAFFNVFDTIVNINLEERFIKEVPYLEAKHFYNLQKTIEDIHAASYSKLVTGIILNPEERAKLIDSVKYFPIISKMKKWADKWIESNEPLGTRLVAWACIEGIFFSGCFCAIYWFKSRGLMPGLSNSNELISRDEGMHTVFATIIYKYLVDGAKCPNISKVIREAVEISIEFINFALPIDMPEMNARLMGTYIKYVADDLASRFNIAPLFGAKNPFHFMKQLNLQLRTNFFEQKTTAYKKMDEVAELGCRKIGAVLVAEDF